MGEDLSVSQGISSAFSGVRVGELAALLARVEQAEGPDRELDSALMLLSYKRGWRKLGVQESGPKGWREIRTNCWVDPTTKKWVTTAKQGIEFTASLDAALALCERLIEEGYPGVQRNRCRPGAAPNRRAWSAYLSGRNVPDEIEAAGNTAPLALVCAVLKALIASPKDDAAERSTEPRETRR